MNIDNKVPPPVVFLLAGFLMWFLSSGAHAPVGSIRVIGIVLCWLAGTAFSIAGIVSFKKARTTVNPLKPEAASTLVVSGVYQVTRNPMYVGLALLLVAWSLYLGSPLSLLGFIAFVAYITRFQIMPEEKAMLTLFGDAYSQYAQRVRRWL